MAKDTFEGIAISRRFGGKVFTFHTRMARKADAEREARFLRASGSAARVVLVPKSLLGESKHRGDARYAIYTRRK